MTTSHTFRGIVLGETAIMGVLDGYPRLVVARPGNSIVTVDPDGTQRLHTDVMSDTARIAFDSSWSDLPRVIAEGIAICDTSNKVDDYALVANFSDPGFTPIAILNMRGGAIENRETYEWGGNQTTTPPGYEYGFSNLIPTRVDRTSVRVRLGNWYNGYWYPTDPIHYIVIGAPVL